MTEVQDNIFRFDTKGNVLVLPIARKTKKDGHIVFEKGNLKIAAELYPQLDTQWYILLQYGLKFLSYVTKNGATILGVPVKQHYASKVDEDLLVEAIQEILRISETAETVYLAKFSDSEEITQALLKGFESINNVILVKPM